MNLKSYLASFGLPKLRMFASMCYIEVQGFMGITALASIIVNSLTPDEVKLLEDMFRLEELEQ